jgi:tripeptidyl-peptidase-1
VGATELAPYSNAEEGEETAVTGYATGGGFSNIYIRPEYQESAVTDYFARSPVNYSYYETTDHQNIGGGADKRGKYNRAGRAYPDVSAIGDNCKCSNLS